MGNGLDREGLLGFAALRLRSYKLQAISEKREAISEKREARSEKRNRGEPSDTLRILDL
jgi:hypothetical protein